MITALPTRAELLAQCEEGVALARSAGAHEAEVIADFTRQAVASAQNNDLYGLEVRSEAQFGVRVFVGGGRQGFATTNRPEGLAAAASAAVAVARAAPPDPHAGLPLPIPLPEAPDALDEALLSMSPAAQAAMLVAMLAEIRAQDARVSVDKAAVEVEGFARALASSAGVRAAWRGTSASLMAFGMAVDGADVGSLAEESAGLARASDLEAEREALVARFVRDCVGGLKAGAGESFRGTVLLTAPAAAYLLIAPLMSALSAEQVRQGRSPLASRLGERIAPPGLTLREEGAGLPEYPLSPFDREGMPRVPRALIEDGHLRGFLWSSYEARHAGLTGEVGGHAQGSATSPPQVGPGALSLHGASPLPMQVLEAGQGSERLLVVTRFAGMTDPVSGEFSGVVKGGFLVQGGERRPVQGVTIAGNLYESLRNISATSAERWRVRPTWRLPALRIEDVSVTAG